MKAECIVLREIDYYKESIEFLFQIVNHNTYEELKNYLKKRLDIKRHAKISEQLDRLSFVEEDIRKNIDLSNADLQFYFKRFAYDDLCLAKILYQTIGHTIFKGNQEELANYITKYFEHVKNNDNLELTLTSYEVEVSKYDANHTVSFTNRIGNLECDAAQKWQLLDLIEHSKEHLERLFPILESTILKMRKHDTILEKLKKEACDYWEDYFVKNDFMKLICSFYNFKEDSYPVKPSFIRPQIMNCNRVIFNGNDENAGDYHILDIGITFDCEFKATKNTFTKEQLCNGLKLLSDPSKFEILRFINGRRAYGQEIAAELNLTTATISHHMSALMMLGLINIEKVDNRVYYQMNKEAVTILLDETKHVLLQEVGKNNEI